MVFAQKPDFCQVSPAIPYLEVTSAEGHHVLRVATLGAKEFFTIQLLSYTQLPQILYVRSAAGAAKILPFQIQRKFPTWYLAIIGVLLIVGLGFSAYWVIRAVIFISQNIGVASPAA